MAGLWGWACRVPCSWRSLGVELYIDQLKTKLYIGSCMHVPSL